MYYFHLDSYFYTNQPSKFENHVERIKKTINVENEVIFGLYI